MLHPFHKKNGEFIEYHGPMSANWCAKMRKRDPTIIILKYLMKKINPKLIKPCPIFGRYEVENFSFGRQYFINLLPNEYQYHFKLVDETTKTVMQLSVDVELIDH